MSLFGLLIPGVASADEPVSLRRTQTQQTLPPPIFAPLRGTELAVARELQWSRLSLSEESSLSLSDSTFVNPRAAELPFMDLRSELWLSSPLALTSLATAASSLITSGISVFDVWRGNRLRQRHSVRGYFKSRGLKISWRVRF